jgi:hypothetical protein
MIFDGEAGRPAFLRRQSQPSCRGEIQARQNAEDRQKTSRFEALLHGPGGVLLSLGLDENDAGRIKPQTGQARAIGAAILPQSRRRRAPQQGGRRLSDIRRQFFSRLRKPDEKRQGESHGRPGIPIFLWPYFVQADGEASPRQGAVDFVEPETPWSAFGKGVSSIGWRFRQSEALNGADALA